MEQHCGLRVEGNGPIGNIQVRGAFDLTPAPDGTTVDYAWEVIVGGPMAGVANRVLGGVAKMMLGQFLKNLDSEMESRRSAQSTA